MFEWSWLRHCIWKSFVAWSVLFLREFCMHRWRRTRNEECWLSAGFTLELWKGVSEPRVASLFSWTRCAELCVPSWRMLCVCLCGLVCLFVLVVVLFFLLFFFFKPSYFPPCCPNSCRLSFELAAVICSEYFNNLDWGEGSECVYALLDIKLYFSAGFCVGSECRIIKTLYNLKWP